MKLAYLDTSYLLALGLGEEGSAALVRRLERFDRFMASNLLEAELRAAFAREGLTLTGELFDWMKWVFPERPLTPELEQVLSRGYLKGADAWHLACALYAAEDPRALTFLTLDRRQRAVARRLGFPT